MHKTYEPSAIETSHYQRWEAQDYFKPSGHGTPFALMLPPPNITGTLHMGHGFEHTLMDILVRYHRMLGDNTLWQGGSDHAGIATQMVVERLLEAEGTSRTEIGREAFLKRVWAWKEQSGNTIAKQMRRLGASPDWSRDRFTMDEGLSTAVQKAFVELYEEGLIYRGERLVNWDVKLQTALSDLEVISEEEDGKLWLIRYSSEYPELVIATTRPETLLGDTAIAVHPDDKRYSHLIGKEITVPLTPRKIPIIADTYVDPAFGTGCVKITPAHDFNDYEIAKRHQLPMINLFTEAGRMNQHAPERYRGLDRLEAREKILTELEIVEIKPHKLKVPRSDRSGVIVEPRLTVQWYVKMQGMAEKAIEAVKQGDIQFFPQNAENTYFEWLNNIQDWCISRQLWWGHRIPAFYDSVGNVYVGNSEKDVRVAHQIPDSTSLHQDEDVLDTWFSSALWPFSTLGWPEKTHDFKTYYPTSTLVTGFDLIFFWVARMIMFGLKFTGKVPFKQVYFHGIIRDHEGQKMSKSKGNVLDPVDLIDGIDLDSLLKKRTYGMMQPRLKESILKATKTQFPKGIAAFGCDALRFTFTALASTSRDINFDMNRMEGYRNFCNKLWNAARFVMMHLEPAEGQNYSRTDEYTLSNVDEWIFAKLNQTIETCHHAIADYRFDLLAQAIYEFVWNDYCDWYVEFSKVVLQDPNRSVEEKNGAKFTLINVLETVLRLAHPVIPFITEEIFETIRPHIDGPYYHETSLTQCPYPLHKPELSEINLAEIQRLITGIRSLRSENNISPAKKIPAFAHCANEETARWLDQYRPWIEQLCRLESLALSKTPPEDSLSLLIDSVKISIPMEGLIDKAAEKAKLSKLKEKLQGDIARTEAMLHNEKFQSSAPATVIEKEQNRLRELVIHLEEVQQKLNLFS